ncbi:MAG: DNA topoisomerase (ATP-hydrolyzing) [Clostridia bacterium]
MEQIDIDSINPEIEKLPDGSNLITKDMETVMKQSMMPYAEYVIMDRAIPRVEDGLKPVQRRILYAMYDLGLTPDKTFKKSARIVGECLGKYHPHGDGSVYNAMVRMAQGFNLNCPLVEGQGNFGSVDGDGPAAMRYTEARLSELSMELLKDIDKETVHFSRNFDDSTKEPDMLPGRFPNLLVNGASGIAVGLATSIPPHNLSEVINGVIAYIDNSKITLPQLMKYITGPDFPTGGYCIGGEGLISAYETGRGKVVMRAKCNIERLDNGREQIVITELPFQVNKSALLVDILKVKEDKKDKLAGIAEIIDESDKEGMRAVIKVRKDFNCQQILDILFKCTNLQCNFNINMVAIADGKPQLMGLLDIIAYYTNYQRAVVLARSKFELEEARGRAHILEGLVIAVTNIDEVVRIIRSSSSTNEAKQKLRVRFELTDRQAQAILDLRLARLTRLEVDKLKEELELLQKLIARLEEIVRSPKALMQLLKDELIAIKKAYKYDRKSIVIDNADYAQVKVISNEIPVENTVICVTSQGLIKRVSSRNYSLSNKDNTDKASLPCLCSQILQTITNRKVLFFTNFGNCYQLEAGRIKETKYRDDAMTLVEAFGGLPEEKVVKVLQLDELSTDLNLLVFTRLGLVKRTSIEEYLLLKASFVGYKGKEDDDVINVEVEIPQASVFYVSSSGMCLNFATSEIPIQGRVAGGVKGMMLGEGDTIVFAGQITPEGEIALISNKCYVKRTPCVDLPMLTRYRKGVKIFDLQGSNGSAVLTAGYFTQQISFVVEDVANTLAITSAEMSKESRTGKGKLPKSCKKALNLINAIRYVNE